MHTSLYSTVDPQLRLTIVDNGHPERLDNLKAVLQAYLEGDGGGGPIETKETREDEIHIT